MGTRQQIVDAAERVVKEKGLAKVTARDIAREAGYADGTLYTHFVHKEDIFLAVILENLPQLVASLEENVGKRTVSANLEDVVFSALTFYEEIIPLTASFFAEPELMVRYREKVREQNGGPQRSYDFITHYIQEEQRIGRIGEHVDPTSVAVLLLGASFQYVFFQLFMGKNPLSITKQEFVKNLVQTLMQGTSPDTE